VRAAEEMEGRQTSIDERGRHAARGAVKSVARAPATMLSLEGTEDYEE
jgi:hypothetical protein